MYCKVIRMLFQAIPARWGYLEGIRFELYHMVQIAHLRCLAR